MIYCTIQDVIVGYRNKLVLRVNHLEMEQGEVFILLGRSGSGKTTLLKAIAGLIRPVQGSIQCGGIEVTALRPGERKKFFSQVGIVFQEGALFDSMSVWENLVFPMKRKHIRMKEWKPRVQGLLEAVGLNGDILSLLPSELSGGMKRRVGLARALAAEPRVILFDEPTGGLDPITSSLICQLIDRVKERVDLTVIATHDLHLVQNIGDHIALVESGEILTIQNRDAFFQIQKGEFPLKDRVDVIALKQFLDGNPIGPLKITEEAHL